MEVKCDSCGQVFTSEFEPKFCVNCSAQLFAAPRPELAEKRQLENGYAFSGKLNERGQPTDVGILSNEDESIEGEFVDGFVVGVGKQLYLPETDLDQLVYIGEFEHNIPRGVGKRSSPRWPSSLKDARC